MKHVTQTAQGRRPSRRRRWLLGTLLVAFAVSLAVGGAYHRAQAQMDESLMDLGSRMMHYSDADPQRAPRDLVLNGQVMQISTGTAPRSASDVLDVFEQRCADADGELMEQLEQLQNEHPGVREVSMLEAPIIRFDGSHSGYVACLDLGPTSVSVTELADRLGRYRDTGDVAEIGEARYVFAEQSGTGADASTHFVALWTSGSFNMREMFPQEGDAPGDDPDGVSRPPESRRVLQGFERGQPHTMTVYESRQDEADLERFYERSLSAQGWSVSVNPQRTGRNVPTTFVAEQGNRMAIVVLTTSMQTGRASAAIFETQ